jgi:transposase
LQNNCKRATLGGMNAYSKDLRLKVLSAVERGVPRREISELLGISISTISRYVQRKASGEEIAPKPSPGRTSKILAEPDLRRVLWGQLEENDTATLREHSEMFEEECGISVSVATMSRAVRTLGWTFKKDRWHPPSATSEGGALLRAT